MLRRLDRLLIVLTIGCLLSDLHAQSPIQLLIIRRAYEYTQVDDEKILPVKARLTVSIFLGTNPDLTAEVSLNSKDKTFILTPGYNPPSPGEIAHSHAYQFESSDFTLADTELPPGEYTLTYPSAAGSSTQKYQINLPPFDPNLRLTNYASTQNWDGGALYLTWVAQPTSSPLQPSLHFRVPDGTVVFTAPYYSGQSTAPSGFLGDSSSTITLANLPSVSGTVLTGSLTFARATPGISSSGANFIFSSDLSTVRFSVKRPAPAPLITTQPASLTAIAGTGATFSPVISGSGATYVWQKDGTTLTGATNATLTLTNIQATDAGAYTVTATNSGGSITSNLATLSVTVPPSVSSVPASQTVVAGTGFGLGVTAVGTVPLTYQWFRNGIPISGATAEIFTLGTTLLADAGVYYVRISNSAGSTTSAPFTLTVTPISRISNLSVLTSLTTPDDNFTLGYVIGGTGTTGPKPLVLRAAGPALAALGVGGTLDDPKLETFTGPTKTGENDNWGSIAATVPSLTSAFTAVGAFPFASPTSRDAAIATSLTTRDNSVKISAASDSTGLVIAEIYDATANDAFITTTPRLLNVSVLKSLGSGLTVGFTIAGSTPKNVLIRAIGPTLGDFGVPGTVADPQLVLFNSSSVKIAENDNWAATAALGTSLTAAFTSVGAFALAPASLDAALLVTLPAGSYTAQVSGVARTTGAALVEIYEVP